MSSNYVNPDTRANAPRSMTCAYCGIVKAWTTPNWVRRPNSVLLAHNGEGEFVNRSYAQCWLCWERQTLQSALAWAKRHWLLRVGRRWA